MNPFVSVVVLTYNPSWQKLKPTLVSILRQKNVDFEILLADDGSANNLQEQASALFLDYSFESFTLLSNPVNRGTVQNLLSALEKAQGTYVYVISPGDFLYEDATLAKLVAFAESDHTEICFGEAVLYAMDAEGNIVLPHGRPLAPSRPDLYRDLNIFRQKAAFFFLDYILGAAYFRKTKTALEMLRKAAAFAKYAEDTPSTLFALAKGIPVHYFPEPVVWYDCGEGISTQTEPQKENRWQQILSAEYRAAYEALLKEDPKDPVLQSAWRYKYEKEEKEPVWKQFLVHPLVVLAFYRRRRFPVKLNAATEENLEKLSDILRLAN